MSLFTYILVLYVMMCIAAFVIVRAAVAEPIMRNTFLLIGCFAPFFAVYIVGRTIFISKETTPASEDEKNQIMRSAEEIEQHRVKRFGGTLFQIGSKVKLNYVRALNETAEKIEGVVIRIA